MWIWMKYQFDEKIHDTHGIEFLDYDISFKGICPKCRREAKRNNMDKKAMYKLSYGLFVLTAREAEKITDASLIQLFRQLRNQTS